MLRSLSRRTLIMLTTISAFLVMAPSAFADSIRYDAVAGPNYTVDNEQGIVKITYNTCLTVGSPTTLAFAVTTNISKDGNATFHVIKDETGPDSNDGALPTSVFDPPTVALVAGADQTFNVNYTFTPTEATGNGPLLRVKLDGENGEGIGNGPGFMVKINCVQPAAQQAPGGAPVAGGQPVATVPVVAPSAALGQARCVGLRQAVKLRKGKLTTVMFNVRNSQGQGVNRAYVRLLGAGVNVAKFTTTDGKVSFKVRPARAGTLFIQSNVCGGADRVAVLGAAAAPGITNGVGGPRYTG